MKPAFLITDGHFSHSWLHSCVTPSSYPLCLPPPLFDWPIYLPLHLAYSYFLLWIPPCFSVDCNKTLAPQFMFAPLSPKSGPATIISCGPRRWVTAIRRRYLELKLHTTRPTSTLPLSCAPSRGLVKVGLITNPGIQGGRVQTSCP